MSGATLMSGLVRCGTMTSVFDISTLSLSGWFDGDNYNSTTGAWTGKASAGTSGSNSITADTGAKPTTGSTLNGCGTVAFARASSQSVADSTSVLSTYITTSAWSIWALINNTSSVTSNSYTVGYDNHGIISDSLSYWAIGTSTNAGGVSTVYQWDTAARGAQQALTDSSWSLVQAYYDGSNVYMRVNSGTWQSGASGSIGTGLGSSKLYLGKNYNSGAYFNGSMANVGLSKTAFSQATFDNIKSALNSKYGLSM